MNEDIGAVAGEWPHALFGDPSLQLFGGWAAPTTQHLVGADRIPSSAADVS